MDSYNKYNDIAFKLFNEMTEEKNPQPKSSMPEKRAMTFIKEMKGQFKMGEEVDVVKEGSSYNIFKKNVAGGAHPVRFNEKQAEEFFGRKLNEAFQTEGVGEFVGKGLRAAGSAVKGFASGVAQGVTGKTGAERAIDAGIKKIVAPFQEVLKAKGIERTEGKITDFLQKQVFKPIFDKYAPSTPEKPQAQQGHWASQGQGGSQAAPAASAPAAAPATAATATGSPAASPAGTATAKKGGAKPASPAATTGKEGEAGGEVQPPKEDPHRKMTPDERKAVEQEAKKKYPEFKKMMISKGVDMDRVEKDKGLDNVEDWSIRFDEKTTPGLIQSLLSRGYGTPEWNEKRQNLFKQALDQKGIDSTKLSPKEVEEYSQRYYAIQRAGGKRDKELDQIVTELEKAGKGMETIEPETTGGSGEAPVETGRGEEEPAPASRDDVAERVAASRKNSATTAPLPGSAEAKKNQEAPAAPPPEETGRGEEEPAAAKPAAPATPAAPAEPVAPAPPAAAPAKKEQEGHNVAPIETPPETKAEAPAEKSAKGESKEKIGELPADIDKQLSILTPKQLQDLLKNAKRVAGSTGEVKEERSWLKSLDIIEEEILEEAKRNRRSGSKKPNSRSKTKPIPDSLKMNALKKLGMKPLQTLIQKLEALLKPKAAAPETTPIASVPSSDDGIQPTGENQEESISWQHGLLRLEEEKKSGGFKPGKAKFTEKFKIKDPKTIGAFRKGKVGSGSKLPKD